MAVEHKRSIVQDIFDYIESHIDESIAMLMGLV